MVPETRLHIEVEVRADQGMWWPGHLEHWRKRGGRWGSGSGTQPA